MSTHRKEPTTTPRRDVTLPGAILLGLGSIVGTGVFVSIGIATDVTGTGVFLAIVIAGCVAAANGLSSAQLAAAHPVSGGTYEYGHRWLTPALGFSAGLLFLLAKSASAATAALGFSGYLLEAAGYDGANATTVRTALACLGTLALTAFVAGGIRRSNRANAVVVVVALSGLAALAVVAIPTVLTAGSERLGPIVPPSEEGGVRALLEGAALLFVAFTGYGRIATLGEEVRDPGRVIPRAMIVTVVTVTALYLAIAITGVGVLGAEGFSDATATNAAPLEAVARALDVPLLAGAVALSAIAAMVGVLLNLLLGLSRVLLAMARRGDAPKPFARIETDSASPSAAVWACGGGVAALTLIGDVTTTWSFSAFTVLVYYALTNAAAIRLPRADRLFPHWVAWAGLLGCLSLALLIDLPILLSGVALLVAGLLLRGAIRHGR